MMVKKIKFLFMFLMLFAVTASVSAYSPLKYGINPHDSLLFDGEITQAFNSIVFSDNLACFTRVVEVKGNVIGQVLTKEIVMACGENETLYTVVERFLKKGDMLMPNSKVITSVDSEVDLGFYLLENSFSSVYLNVGPESQITAPSYTSCRIRVIEQEQAPPEEIKVIKGIVTYDAEPDAGIKAITKGKRSTGKHKKTRYSHEVKITESDTLDIIRVYKGAVEVTMENIDIDESDMTKKLEKLSEDMQAGKLTAEEMQTQMAEFQNIGQMVNELMQPLNVDEGFKCTVTRNSRKVEPLGAGDEDIK